MPQPWALGKVLCPAAVPTIRHEPSEVNAGAERALTLSETVAVANEESEVDVLVLHEALIRLAELDPRQARVVELRYFGGLSIPEAAVALGVSHATVERDWRNARLWLRHELSPG